MQAIENDNKKSTTGLKSLPPAERPREKLLSSGAQSLTAAELLALLIGSGTRKESALALAGRILSLEEKGLAAFASYTPQEFMQISGIGQARGCILAAAVELGRRIAAAPAAANPLIDSPDAAASLYMEEMRRLPKEVFRVLLLNVKNELILKEEDRQQKKM
ncbi:MAG: hypothetical protein HUJ80_08855 [Firmicutes bacterium]|nr:hypothetical protein [Bacillota bacterium]